MLHTPAPYPEVGSYTLFEDAGYTHLARIEGLIAGEALISFPMRSGAGGNRRVPPESLIDPTPLSAAEARDMEALETRIDAERRARPRRAKDRLTEADLTRANALRLRSVYWQLLRDRIEEAERKKLVAPGTRHALLELATAA